MNKIQLSIDRVLQGNFELQAVNLLFVFQVNCPGCFLYGFPLVNHLYGEYRQRGLQVLGLSTAFEDFYLNTAANTELLLTEKSTVGETRKALGEKYLQAIDFPIAVDTVTTGTELNSPANIEFLSKCVAGFDDLPEIDRNPIRQQMATYLQRQSQTSATFCLNRLPGTPTFLLVGRDLNLLAQWFGHQSEAFVTDILERYL
jgi:hypothetical protein